MLQITPQMRIFVAVQPVDFRNGIDGLVRLCKEVLDQDPFHGGLFVFRNRSATSVKALVYDGQGFWLCQMRAVTIIDGFAIKINEGNSAPRAGPSTGGLFSCPLFPITNDESKVAFYSSIGRGRRLHRRSAAWWPPPRARFDSRSGCIPGSRIGPSSDSRRNAGLASWQCPDSADKARNADRAGRR